MLPERKAKAIQAPPCGWLLCRSVILPPPCKQMEHGSNVNSQYTLNTILRKMVCVVLGSFYHINVYSSVFLLHLVLMSYLMQYKGSETSRLRAEPWLSMQIYKWELSSLSTVQILTQQQLKTFDQSDVTVQWQKTLMLDTPVFSHSKLLLLSSSPCGAFKGLEDPQRWQRGNDFWVTGGERTWGSIMKSTPSVYSVDFFLISRKFQQSPQ